MLINDLRVIQDIEERLQEAIGNAPKLAAHASRLEPVGRGEKVIGRVNSDLLKAMWVVMIELLARSRVELANISLAMTDIDAEEHKFKGHYYDDLNDAVGEIFWAELKLESEFKAGMGQTIAIREDWEVVSYKDQQPPAALRAIFGGAIE